MTTAIRQTACVFETLEGRLFLSAGQLDPHFGHNGQIVLSPALMDFQWLDNAVMQPDGKLITLSQIWRNEFQLCRYGTDYQIDKSFGHAGILYGYNTYCFNLDLALQPDGKILHLYQDVDPGSRPSPNNATLLERYLPDGRLDRSFGNRGTATLWQQGGQAADWSPTCLVPLPDGSILVGGPRTDLPTPSMVIERLTRDGALDQSFGDNGVAMLTVAGVRHFAIDTLLREPDGTILCIGSDQPYNNEGNSASRVIIARFTPDGAIDSGFGDGGVVRAFIRPDHKRRASIYHAALQPDGKIIVSAISNGAYALMLRFNARGTLDRGYGHKGRAIFWRNKSAKDVTSLDLMVQPDFDVVFALPTPKGDKIIVGRLTPDGKIDRTFGHRGFTRTDFGSGGTASDTPIALFAQPDDGVLLVAQGPDHAMFPKDSASILTRYQGGHRVHPSK